jgi:hypothetical protein
MDFRPTDEQRLLRQSVREFAETELAPDRMAWDEAQGFPLSLLPRLGGLGLMGIQFPERYGGAGLDAVDYCICIEELARVDPSIALSVAAHNGLSSAHVHLFGTEAQRARWLPPLAAGRHLGAWALTESGAGSDAGSLRTSARRVDGGWRLNGSKTFTTHATLAETFVVMAVTDAAKGAHGISAFIIERGGVGHRHLEAVVDDVDDAAHRLGGLRGDGARQPEGLRGQRVRLDHPVHEADAPGLLRRDRRAGEHHLESPPPPHQARKPLRAAVAGDDPQRDLGQPQPGRPRRDPARAGHRDLAAAAEGVAVDGGDDRLAEALDEVAHPVPGLGEGARGLRRQPRELADVGPGDERAVAGAGQHDGPDLVVGPEIGERRGQGGDRLRVQGVEHLRPVDGDRGHRSGPFDQDPIVVHEVPSGRGARPRATHARHAHRAPQTTAAPVASATRSDHSAVRPGTNH